MTVPPHAHALPEALTSVVLLQSAKGTELHLRSQDGRLLRLPLAAADPRQGLAALAVMAGAPRRKRRRRH